MPAAGGERGAVRKPWRSQLKVALVFPNHYRVGMANLGFQVLYGLFNAHDEVLCERAFLPEAPAAVPAGHESGRPLAHFDLIAFSVSFENDYPNLIHILDRSGLPRLAGDRSPPHPLVLAGGVACWLNPEPLAPFVDLFLLGEAEGLVSTFLRHLDLRLDRKQLLPMLARAVPGAYVPSLFRPSYGPDDRICAFEPLADVPPRVTRVLALDLDAAPTCTQVMPPHGPFADTFLTEVSRGCPHGCRFCAAGFVYRPPRFRSLASLVACIPSAQAHAARLGLVGAAVSDLPALAELCDAAARVGLPLAFSSLRADALTPQLTAALRRSRIKTATIAPDAGSQRLRDLINKGLGEEQVLQAAETLVAAGIPNLKLYFMVGLPTETDEDVEAIARLAQAVRSRFLAASRDRGRIGRMTVTVSAFVPKPWTPFQWVGMHAPADIDQKFKYLHCALGAVPNLVLQTEAPRQAYLQALLSRGDRRVAALLAHHADGIAWSRIYRQAAPHPDHFVQRTRAVSEILPWDFIDMGVDRQYLAAEYRRALAGRRTPPCPPRGCGRCGACRQGLPGAVAADDVIKVHLTE
jgi:radical SAM superfamily enzyme YgiQ (UPF0313 family)